MNRLTLTALAALIAASTVSADLSLPGFKNIVPRVRFVGVDKHPDYFFCLQISSFAGNPKFAGAVRFEVKNSEPFTLTGTQRRLGKMYVLALDRKEFDKLKGEDKTLAWLTEKTPGVLAAEVPAPATSVSDKLKEVPVTEYSVAIADGKLKAERVPAEKRQSQLTPDAPVRPWVVGIACALSLGLFGVWFARRRQVG